VANLNSDLLAPRASIYYYLLEVEISKTRSKIRIFFSTIDLRFFMAPSTPFISQKALKSAQK
jgi:hypothetical protein